MGDMTTQTTKLVPLKPTTEMCMAGYKAAKVGYWEDRVNNVPFQREGLGSNDPAQIYAAMIAAAPETTNYELPYAVRVTVDDSGEIKSQGISYAEMHK